MNPEKLFFECRIFFEINFPATRKLLSGADRNGTSPAWQPGPISPGLNFTAFPAPKFTSGSGASPKPLRPG
ncbi:MAG UNVERIFIED_CONTAM: hypothetical protein LVR29_22025 [Microcystis novacekii LVE1205-3]|jgi:hypothetical protein